LYPPEVVGQCTAVEASLRTIASCYLGQPAAVAIIDGCSWAGEAFIEEDGTPTIRIDSGLAAHALGKVFFHEVAHHALHHLARSWSANGTVAHLTAVDLLATLPKEQHQAATEFWHSQEAAADAWAVLALGSFEERFGPFLEALLGPYEAPSGTPLFPLSDAT
jgi:hypothetical protein